MRTVVGFALTCGFLVLGSGRAAAQSSLEYAAAAAGGSVGGVAGKGLSAAIDKVFRKVDEKGEQALKIAGEPQAAKAPGKTGKAAVKVEKDLPAMAPAARGRRSRPAVALPAVALPAVAPSSDMAAFSRAAAAVPERPQVTRDQLASLQPGVSAQNTIAALGRPSARISIPEEGRLLEIYQYSANGHVIGAVRLSGGVVSGVRISGQ
jgi:hypothetical protein